MNSSWIRFAGLIIVALVITIYQINTHVLSGIGTPSADTSSQYQDGVYVGTGEGYNGNLSIQITIDRGRIRDLNIIDSGDDASYLKMTEPLLEEIKEKQGIAGVDTISGATMSSRGIIQAVDKALTESEDQ